MCIRNICGIVIGEAVSPEEAKRRAESMKNCPNIVVLGTTANVICFVCIVPSEKAWWLKYPEANPRAIGLEKAVVHIVRDVLHPQEFMPWLPEKKPDTAPCGANCHACPLRWNMGVVVVLPRFTTNQLKRIKNCSSN